MKKILVLALGTKDRSDNSLFEETLVDAIRNNGGVATGYLAETKGLIDTNKETVTALVNKINADGILVTQLKSINYDTKVKEGKSEVAVTPYYHAHFVDVFTFYSVKDLKNPDQIKAFADVVVTADLYSAKDGKLTWAAESTSMKNEYAIEAIEDIAQSIVSELNKKSFLK